MNTLYPLACAFLCMYIGYRFYSKYLAERVFRLDDSTQTPAFAQQDGVDYVPTNRTILFSHHFASIAGLSPIVGPAIAVIWGWLPAMIWLVVGAVLMGAVHDMTALVISIRNKGRSIGDVCEKLIGWRARILFLLMIYVLLALVAGAFTAIVANLLQAPSESLTFTPYPEANLPAVALIAIAMVVGVLMRQKRLGLLNASVIGVGLTLVFIWLGSLYPIHLEHRTLCYLLLAYALSASVLPVWLLLQPRDYINTLSLYLGLFLLYFAIIFSAPSFTAPAVNPNPTLPSIFPLLFVTIACGAISGFHCAVASGTTAKQLSKESHARPVGYGAMIGECALGIAAVIACAAGVASADVWHGHYSSWEATGGMYGSIAFFVMGAANFISWLGVPMSIATTFVTLLIVSFALTTLDSGTRLLRYNIEEICGVLGIRRFVNRYLASLLAVMTIAVIALSDFGRTLWILLGTVNQLLAALGLMVGTVYLLRLSRNYWVTAIPMALMMIVTFTAMIYNMRDYIQQENTVLIIVGGFISLLTLGLLLEAALFYLRWRKGGFPEDLIDSVGDTAKPVTENV